MDRQILMDRWIDRHREQIDRQALAICTIDRQISNNRQRAGANRDCTYKDRLTSAYKGFKGQGARIGSRWRDRQMDRYIDRWFDRQIDGR